MSSSQIHLEGILQSEDERKPLLSLCHLLHLVERRPRVEPADLLLIEGVVQLHFKGAAVGMLELGNNGLENEGQIKCFLFIFPGITKVSFYRQKLL